MRGGCTGIRLGGVVGVPVLYAHAVECDLCGVRLEDPRTGHRWWRGGLLPTASYAAKLGWTVEFKLKVFLCPECK